MTAKREKVVGRQRIDFFELHVAVRHVHGIGRAFAATAPDRSQKRLNTGREIARAGTAVYANCRNPRTGPKDRRDSNGVRRVELYLSNPFNIDLMTRLYSAPLDFGLPAVRILIDVINPVPVTAIRKAVVVVDDLFVCRLTNFTKCHDRRRIHDRYFNKLRGPLAALVRVNSQCRRRRPALSPYQEILRGRCPEPVIGEPGTLRTGGVHVGAIMIDPILKFGGLACRDDFNTVDVRWFLSAWCAIVGAE